MTTLSIDLPEPLAARLEAIAREQNLTKAEVAREVLTAYVSRIEECQTPPSHGISRDKTRDRQPRPGSALASMGDLVGSLEGPGDLSTNPAYMEGFGES